MGSRPQGEDKFTTTHAVCRPQRHNKFVNDSLRAHAQPTRGVSVEDSENVPIWRDFFRCEMGNFPAGSYNVSVMLEYGLAFASPEGERLFTTDGTGQAYDVQIFPTITGISPTKGSLEGGTVVEIRGGGFSMDEDENNVLINGRPCIISYSTLELIQCVTTPVHVGGNTTPAATCGNYECPEHLTALPNQTELHCRNASACVESDCCAAADVALVVIHDEVSTQHGVASGTL